MIADWTPAQVARFDQALAKADAELAGLAGLYRNALAEMSADDAWTALSVRLADTDRVLTAVWLATAVRRQVEAETVPRTVPCALCGLPIPSGEATHQACSPRVVGR